MVAILFWFGFYLPVSIKGSPACPNEGLSVINMCKGGSLVKSNLLMDFSFAQHSSVTTCRCEILVIKGRQFHFSQVTAPGYVGCGTEIHVQKNDKPHSGDIIPCYGGTTVPGLKEGNTLQITIMKHNSPFDVHYCYRLDITGATDAAMSVTCYNEINQPTTTEQVSTTGSTETVTLTNDVTTTVWNTSQSETSLHDKNLNLAPYINTQECNKSTLYTVIALLLVLLTAVACFAAIITFKFFTRDYKKPEKLQQNNDIYEEIPARNYISSKPVYETEVQKRRYSNIQNGDQNTLQSNVPGHWNWTYDEHRETDTRYEKPNPAHTYEYDVAKF
ncbi:uncharacterized protein LOC134244510 [Saccostrea cucullata]|uniref:uncharacterized protein LOC134244510 n=1 Tax=Saccostrea cuccullata TaxID=36930 RepID=UPI002ED41992